MVKLYNTRHLQPAFDAGKMKLKLMIQAHVSLHLKEIKHTKDTLESAQISKGAKSGDGSQNSSSTTPVSIEAADQNILRDGVRNKILRAKKHRREC